MTKQIPTLVTYRSAVELRDAGIRYAYLRAGMHAGILLGCSAAGMALYLALGGDVETRLLQMTLFIAGIASILGAYFCGHRSEFPHCPRVSLEDIEAMRDDMGLPPAVFRQTHDSVLHGSFAEHKAIEQTDAILARAKRVVRN